MSFVLLFRNEEGKIEYFNKLFSSEAECFEFTRVHRITDYEILSEQEFQAWIQSQQQRSGYQQRVSAVSDEREPEREPRRQIPIMMRNYRPAFVNFTPVKKIRR